MIAKIDKPILQITLAESEILAELLDRFLPGVKVWAYGSRISNEFRKNSDLDLVVFANKDLRQSVFSLHEALEESNLGFKVDLHVWDELPLEFQKSITANYLQI